MVIADLRLTNDAFGSREDRALGIEFGWHLGASLQDAKAGRIIGTRVVEGSWLDFAALPRTIITLAEEALAPAQ